MINKNVSVWRGDTTPPTKFHLWIKSDGSLWLYIDDKWVNKTQSQIDEIYGTPTPSEEFSSLRAIEDNLKVFGNTDSVNITTEGTKVVADVNVAPDSDIIVNKDGLYNKVETEFKDGVLSLKVNGQVRSSHDIGLDSIVEDAYYDKSTELIVVVFKLHDGSSLKVLINASDLIDEWDVNNDNIYGNIYLNKIRRTGNDKDLLQAYSVISNNNDNILKLEWATNDKYITKVEYEPGRSPAIGAISLKMEDITNIIPGMMLTTNSVITSTGENLVVYVVEMANDGVFVISINNFNSEFESVCPTIPKGTIFTSCLSLGLYVKGTSDNIKHGDITVEDKFKEVDTLLDSKFDEYKEFKENLECYLFLDYPYPADSDLAKSIEIKKNWNPDVYVYEIPSDLKYLPIVDMSKVGQLNGKNQESKLCKIPSNLNTSNINTLSYTFSYSKFKVLDLSEWDLSNVYSDGYYGYSCLTFTYMENVEKIILSKSNIAFELSFFTGDNNLTTLIMPEIKEFGYQTDLNKKGTLGFDLATTLPKLGLGSDEALESFVFTFIDSINSQTTPVNLKVTQELYNLLTTELLQKASDKGITINYKF